MWRPVLLSAQQVGFFNIGSGIGRNTGFRSGRSVEIYDQVFSGILFTLGNFRVFLGIQDPRISSLFLEVVSQIFFL